jgi:hypothetical protein
MSPTRFEGRTFRIQVEDVTATSAYSVSVSSNILREIYEEESVNILQMEGKQL